MHFRKRAWTIPFVQIGWFAKRPGPKLDLFDPRTSVAGVDRAGAKLRRDRRRVGDKRGVRSRSSAQLDANGERQIGVPRRQRGKLAGEQLQHVVGGLGAVNRDAASIPAEDVELAKFKV